MRERMRWSVMRALVSLSYLLPCSFTTRMRSAQTSYCMSRMWTDLH